MSDQPNAGKLLVVDDESYILNVVSLKLRNAGYEVHTADDGEEAYELALQLIPDLVITDYQMPFMTGLELCRKLKEHPETSHIPALMLTAMGFNVDTTELTRTNIAGLLSKPFSPRAVLDKVGELISPGAKRAG